LHDVAAVLGELGIDPARERRLIEVWNKIDKLDPGRRAALFNQAERFAADERPIPVSAITGEGLEALTAAIEQRLAERRQTIELALDPADGAGMSWLHRHTEVLSKELGEDGQMALTVRADADHAGQVRAKFAAAIRQH
jgi:GTP-binding protein HflX